MSDITPQTVSVDQILERYPQLAGFVDHPEIGQLLRDAAENGWGPEELQGALYDTEWYQTTWADWRRLEVLKSTDPAQYAKHQDMAKFEVQALFDTLGVDYSKNPALIDFFAENYLRHGRDDWFLYSEVGKLLERDPKLIGTGGQLAASGIGLRKTASDYLVDYDDQHYNKTALNIWRRADTEEAYKARLIQDALKRFPQFADQLKRGMTVREVMQPVVSTVARTLEINPDMIDLQDGRWRSLHSYVDSDTGTIRPMTLTEAERWARSQEEFKYTKTARDQGFEAINEILREMGAVR